MCCNVAQKHKYARTHLAKLMHLCMSICVCVFVLQLFSHILAGVLCNKFIQVCMFSSESLKLSKCIWLNWLHMSKQQCTNTYSLFINKVYVFVAYMHLCNSNKLVNHRKYVAHLLYVFFLYFFLLFTLIFLFFFWNWISVIPVSWQDCIADMPFSCALWH